MMSKKMSLGLFIQLPGQHLASWRHPSSQSHRNYDIDYLIEIAQAAERGKFDMLFIADSVARPIEASSYSELKLDPLMILAAIASSTKKIGLTVTASTTYNEPFHIARKFGSLDHLSKGRAGWNVVTSANDLEATVYGKEEHLSHAVRYERAEEFIDLAKKFWFSIERDALVVNKERGQFLDTSKVHPIRHDGKWFRANGLLDAPEPPQGHPVIVQAGSSGAGKELAARTAEVVFTAAPALQIGKAFYEDVKGRLAKYNRDRDEVKIMPGAYITVAKTEEEAQQKRQELNKLIMPGAGLLFLSEFTQIDFRGFHPDDPFPDYDTYADPTNPRVRYKIICDIAKREGLKTLRDIYERISSARGHLEVIGTPKQIVDQLETWFVEGAADGFNIIPPTFPEDLNNIVDFVIPELQRRGLFREEYEGDTLRSHLGLKIPENPNVKKEISSTVTS
nr:LLM class flavin-dependent oxidoreductase [Cohnella abietis]